MAANCSAEQHLALVASVDPRCLDRVRRLSFAIEQLRSGRSREEVCRLVIERYSVSRWTSWRICCMAHDLAGPRQ